jgi:hypothetical protein
MKVKYTFKDCDEQFQMATLAGHACWTGRFRPSRDNPVHFYLVANEDCVKFCLTIAYQPKGFREGICHDMPTCTERMGISAYFQYWNVRGNSRKFGNSAKKTGQFFGWGNSVGDPPALRFRRRRGHGGQVGSAAGPNNSLQLSADVYQ